MICDVKYGNLQYSTLYRPPEQLIESCDLVIRINAIYVNLEQTLPSIDYVCSNRIDEP